MSFNENELSVRDGDYCVLMIEGKFQTYRLDDVELKGNKGTPKPGAEPVDVADRLLWDALMAKATSSQPAGEFQLYRAEDTEYIEGEGWTPKTGAEPIDPDYKPQPVDIKREALIARRNRRHTLRDRRVQAVQRLYPAGKKVRGNCHRLQRKRQRLVQRLISQR